MLCNKCNAPLEDSAKFCSVCGTPVEIPEEPVVVAPAPVYEATPVAEETPVITEADLPEQFKPLSPWAYFALNLLYSVPVVGFIFLIIFSCKKSNINRRNYTRSFWCAYIILGGILLLALILAAAFGGAEAILRSGIYKL